MTTEVMAWKRLVAEAATTDPSAPLQLESFGAANQIIGYRIYYMLQFAKRAGLAHVSLLTDGGFWIDEAFNKIEPHAANTHVVHRRKFAFAYIGTQCGNTARLALRVD